MTTEDNERICPIHNKPERLVLDPFVLEVHKEELEMWLCEDCEQERRDDI